MRMVLQDTLELRFGTGRGGRCAACTYLALTCVKLQEKEKKISIRSCCCLVPLPWSKVPPQIQGGQRPHCPKRLGPLPLDKQGRWAWRGGGG
jgi:hypothetical protein